MYGFLSYAWGSMTTAQKNTWSQLANREHFTNFNAFVMISLERWSRFLPPSKTYPVNEALSPVALNITTWAPLRRGAKLTYSSISPLNRWGFAIHRSTTTGFAIAPDNCIGFQLYEGTATQLLFDAPLPPATYFYRTRAFSVDGRWGFQTAQRTVIVTG